MSSSQTFYTVTIANGNSTVAPHDGFIDNKRIEDYGTALVTTPASLTLVLSKAKSRANSRYRDMVMQMSAVSNMYIMPNTISGDQTYHTEGTTFSFMVVIEHGDASLTTADESSPGTFLTGADCIKRCVARALFNDMFRVTEVFDPTNSTSVGLLGTTSVIRSGVRIYDNTFEVGAYASSLNNAEANITVTQFSF